MNEIDPTPTSALAIPGVTEAIVLSYFTSFNQGNFEQTAALFAADGGLQPPLDEVIVGQAAIAAYLQQEARGMQLQPHQGTSEVLGDGCTQVSVRGRVQTPLFGVNVAWTFILSSQSQLLLVQVKLLASPQELLKLRG